MRATSQWFRQKLRRFVPLLAVLGLLVGGIATIQIAASAPAFAGSDTYPTSIAGCKVPGTGAIVTCDIKGSSQDAYFDPWREYNRECTSYAAWMLHSMNGFEMPFNADASLWKADARNAGYTVNTTPAVGAVGWKMTSAAVGHVVWVEADNGDGTVNVEDYNAGHTGHYGEHLNVVASTYQYIHFKDISTSPPTPPPPPAPADSPSSAGAVQFQSSGMTQVFVQGPNNSLQTYWWQTGVGWNGPYQVADVGTTFSVPTAVQNQSTGQVQVFVEGANNTLQTYYWSPGVGWNSYQIAGVGTTYSEPGAVQFQSSGMTQVFVQGPNNSLQTYWWQTGVGWNGPYQISGVGTTYSA
jgi:surface antigen